MLPKPIKFSSQIERTRAIAQSLQEVDHDVIFFQEAFTSHFRTVIRTSLKSKYPFTYYHKRTPRSRYLFGSGLFILSRRPLKILDGLYFKKCATADCFANKGAVLIETNGMQLVNTHLQAEIPFGSIRLHQLNQIKEMLQKHSRPSIPQVLIGDLNIDRFEREYFQGQQKMELEATELDGNIQNTTREIKRCSIAELRHYKPEWLDHIWKTPGVNWLKAEMMVKVLNYRKGNLSCPLSDHHAIEGTFSFAQP